MSAFIYIVLRHIQGVDDSVYHMTKYILHVEINFIICMYVLRPMTHYVVNRHYGYCLRSQQNVVKT